MASMEPEHFYGQDETDDLLTIAEATPQEDGTVTLDVVQVEIGDLTSVESEMHYQDWLRRLWGDDDPAAS